MHDTVSWKPRKNIYSSSCLNLLQLLHQSRRMLTTTTISFPPFIKHLFIFVMPHFIAAIDIPKSYRMDNTTLNSFPTVHDLMILENCSTLNSSPAFLVLALAQPWQPYQTNLAQNCLHNQTKIFDVQEHSMAHLPGPSMVARMSVKSSSSIIILIPSGGLEDKCKTSLVTFLIT